MNKKVLVGSLIIIVVICGSIFLLKKNNYYHASPEELTRYESVYHEYPVVFLRKALDAYIGATENKVVNDACIMPPAIDAKSESLNGKETITEGLASFDSNYFKSKFVVWTYNQNKENGNDIEILFKDKPDRIFYAWVGRNKDGEICLLGFNSTNNDPEILKNEIKTMKPYIYDTKYGI